MKKFTLLMALMPIFLTACLSDEPSICTIEVNNKSAKDDLRWHGKYTEKMDCNNGKCSQVRYLTLNKDETFSYEFVRNGKSQYVETGKFTWEGNGNIVNAGRYRFYLNKNKAGYIYDGDTPKDKPTICMIK